MAWTTPKTDFANGDVLTAAEMNAVGSDLQYLYDNDPNAVITTKGDMIGGNASGDAARLAVGSDDQVLVADSSASTGLAWKSYGAQLVAGKNKILNGDFGIWQRGTSIAASTGEVFTADRFATNRDGSGATVTVSRQAFTPGSAPVAGYEGAYFLRFDQSVAGSGTSYSDLQTKIEDVRTLAGQVVTFSFWAKASANYNANVSARQIFGVGGSALVDTYLGTFNVTTSWTRFTASVTLPSVSGKTIGTSSALMLWIDMPKNAIWTVDTWGWQLEAGSVATPFTTATGNPATELAACQWYYWDSREGGSTVQSYSSYSNSTDYLIANVRYPSTMRTTPSVTIGTASGANYVRRISTGGQLAITVTSYQGQAPTGFSGVYCAAAPFVAAVGYDFYILASAEL